MTLLRLLVQACTITAPAMAVAGQSIAPYVFGTLNIAMTASGTQHWVNTVQWADASFDHAVEYRVSLRSTGHLEGANLLNPDPAKRQALRTEYLRRNGMAQIRAAGYDPKSPTLVDDLKAGMARETAQCAGDPSCSGSVMIRYSTLQAIARQPDHSELFSGPPRYLFFFGYPGCAEHVSGHGELHLRGEAAHNNRKASLMPYVIEATGNTAVLPDGAGSLCDKFTVVLDTRDQVLYLDNVTVPAVTGPVHREMYGHTTDGKADVPQPSSLQDWANKLLVLHSVPLQGSRREAMPLTLPPDNNGSLLGSWTGQGEFSLDWSFVKQR